MPNVALSTTHAYEIRGIPVDAVEAGSGPPLVFLHGMSDARFCNDAIELLASEHRVIAPSHPGYGGSQRPADFDSIADIAYLYLDLLEEVTEHDEKAVIVGCSIGAWAAAEIAVRSQERIAALVLSSPIGVKVSDVTTRDYRDLYAISASEIKESLYHDPSFGDVDLNTYSDEELTAHFTNLESTVVYGWKPYMHNPKLPGRLARITKPTLVLAGESDGFVSPKVPRAFAEAIPGARLQTIPEAGHEPEREQPERFSRAVTEFLHSAQLS